MDAICGMIAFYEPKVPDQFGRLVISQFLHVGLVAVILLERHCAFL